MCVCERERERERERKKSEYEVFEGLVPISNVWVCVSVQRGGERGGCLLRMRVRESLRPKLRKRSPKSCGGVQQQQLAGANVDADLVGLDPLLLEKN